MTTKIKQKQLLQWNNLDLSPLDMTETRTEGRTFMKYNCSVRQVPEVHKHRPLAASDNFYKVVNVKSVIASAHLWVRKARSRAWISGKVRTLSLLHWQRNAFEIHLPRRVPPLLQMLQTAGLKQGRLLGLVGKAKSHAAALDTSAMPLSE